MFLFLHPTSRWKMSDSQCFSIPLCCLYDKRKVISGVKSERSSKIISFQRNSLYTSCQLEYNWELPRPYLSKTLWISNFPEIPSICNYIESSEISAYMSRQVQLKKYRFCGKLFGSKRSLRRANVVSVWVGLTALCSTAF